MWVGILGGLASDAVGLRWEHVSNKLQWCCWPRDHALSSKATLPLGKKRKGYVSRLVSVVESFLADKPWLPDWWVREGDWPTRWVVPWETTFLGSASPSPTTSRPWDPTASLPAAWTGGRNKAPRAEPMASDILSTVRSRGPCRPSPAPCRVSHPWMSLQSVWVILNRVGALGEKTHHRVMAESGGKREAGGALPRRWGGWVDACWEPGGGGLFFTPHPPSSSPLAPKGTWTEGGRKAHKGQGGQCEMSSLVLPSLSPSVLF